MDMRTYRPLALMAALLLAATLLAADKAPEPAPPDRPAVTPQQTDDDIVELLKAEGGYKITLAALDDTKLSAMLQKKGPYTFFAPTDEAYQRVPELADLLNDAVKLREVLTRHIVLDRAMTLSSLIREKNIVTMSGETLEVSPDGERVRDAEITSSNRMARNGAVHGVDHLFMEENDSALRGAGYTLEHGVKSGARKVYDGLKTGARKIKEAFAGKGKDETKSETTGETTAEKPPAESEPDQGGAK